MQSASVTTSATRPPAARWRALGSRALHELSRRMGQDELDYSIIDGIVVLWGNCPERRPAAEIQRALTRLRRALPKLDEHAVLYCADQRFFRAAVDHEGTMIELENLAAGSFEQALEQAASAPPPALRRWPRRAGVATANADPAPAARATAPAAARRGARARSGHG